MKIMFSAGEASGDIHAATVATAIKTQAPSVDLIGMGGTKMAAAGVRILYDIKHLGFIGAVEIIKKIPFFFKLRDFLVDVIDKERPDVLVCVDYPGFNMKLMKAAKKRGIPVIYYILPTIWAWHKSRGKEIARYTDAVASIFPFEAQAYEEAGANVIFVGHPSLDIVKPTLSLSDSMVYFGVDETAVRVLLMPGSRYQEVRNLLPLMLDGVEQMAKNHPNMQFFIPRATTIDKALLLEIIGTRPLRITITEEKTYDVMQCCQAAVVASGTATLETALMGLPTLLVYRVAPLTFFLGKRFVKLSYVGLPNIISGHQVIPELLQEAVTPLAIRNEICRIIDDREYNEKMKQGLRDVRHKLGDFGAVNRVASLILQFQKGI